MTTITMQGNLEIVREILGYLAYAADTSDKTWLERLRSANDLDKLYDNMSKEYPALSESKINKATPHDPRLTHLMHRGRAVLP